MTKSPVCLHQNYFNERSAHTARRVNLLDTLVG